MGVDKRIYYYYTPLPLNLANKTSNKQATSKHVTILFWPLHLPNASGLDSTLNILEPRWWPCQIQALDQRLTGGGPGRWHQVLKCPPKSAQLLAENTHFSPKIAPKPGLSAKMKGNSGYTPCTA